MPLFAARQESSSQYVRDLEAKSAAMNRSQAVIEFNLDGTVIDANDNFLTVLGYTSAEIAGRHHSLFMDPAEAASEEYRDFWRRLNAGEFFAGQFRRIGKGGRECWIRASYNPVLDAKGRPYKVIKFALDVTASETERRRADAEREEAARAQALLIQELAASLARLSEGDLTAVIDTALDAKYDRIKDDFNRAVPALRDTMQGIADATRSLRAGSAEIARAADDLSRRTEQQAASLEQTAAALDQITATVRRSAEGAKAASAAAGGAKADAETSGEIVRHAVEAMSQIDGSSRQISQIIGVIDEIAFQTNLLALNAGVEAARAGDAGRGFAVVVQEVRALAQRSAEAAKEIKGLISSSAGHVSRGVQLVGETGDALAKIAGRVVEIDSLVVEMARSSQEQSQGLDQVNAAINQMDQVTQQNAAMVEQTNAAAASLRREADELGGMVGRFRITEAGAARPVAAQQARARAYAMGQ